MKKIAEMVKVELVSNVFTDAKDEVHVTKLFTEDGSALAEIRHNITTDYLTMLYVVKGMKIAGFYDDLRQVSLDFNKPIEDVTRVALWQAKTRAKAWLENDCFTTYSLGLENAVDMM